MRIEIIQPPMIQINTPYPSGAYLSAFFKEIQKNIPQISSVHWTDMGNLLFNYLFSKKGIKILFEKTGEQALKIAEKEEHRNPEAAFNIRRFISESSLWTEWIDKIRSFLLVQNPANILKEYKSFSGEFFKKTGFRYTGWEFAHEFINSPFVPRGMRMENYICNLGRNPTTEDVKILSTLAISDLCDYINFVFDKNFELIRYGESISSKGKSFEEIRKILNSPVLNTFYKPILDEYLKNVYSQNEDAFFCISIPFPGTLAGALFTGREIKNFSNINVSSINIQRNLISIGGGYVNTELRDIKDSGIFDYTDFISYDRGYGGYHQIFSIAENLKTAPEKKLSLFDKILESMDGRKFYKTSYSVKEDNSCSKKIITGLFPEIKPEKSHDPDNNCNDIEEISLTEDKLTQSLIPDYSEIDFSFYPRVADNQNPMHRLWSDGSWIKAYLAHGCYWKKCAFCDTTLDYVCEYKRTNIKNLYNGLFQQAEKAGVYGIHFVDEAAPPKDLREFAAENILYKENNGECLSFWGNIRFEKVFTRDLTDFLSYGGLIGVSGGIEVPTKKGLESVGKGLSLNTIVKTCAAFKESGILVHGYMIFGLWNESPQEIIDSMEILRQLFLNGLIDSAFWHKFVLTKHSRIFKEWIEGKHPDLIPLTKDGEKIRRADFELQTTKYFAENDLRFAGEEESEKYSTTLNLALENWMNGRGLNKKVCKWFPLKMPEPRVSEDLILKILKKYEEEMEKTYKAPVCHGQSGRYIWIAGKPFVTYEESSHNGTKKKALLNWIFKGEMFTMPLDLQIKTQSSNQNNKNNREGQNTGENNLFSEKIPEILWGLRNTTAETQRDSNYVLQNIPENIIHELRGRGLCYIKM